MKFTLRGASSAAILAGLAGSLPVWAQQTPAPEPTPAPQVDQTAPQAADEQTEDDRVVVTGSFIAGTPEDAALPVEVFSQEQLEKEGAPTALEFVKSLSSSGPTLGEAYYFAGAANTGNVGFNLRGIGADKTLTLLNGRRMSENASYIPAAALARTEILKDGAAVIYGADATGGVVNFITREGFTGLEAKGEYKYISGSDGDYGLHLLGGLGDGDVNFLWAAEWEHRSRLEAEERKFSRLPYTVNPAPWSPVTDLARYTPRGTQPITAITAANQFGSPTGSGVPDFSPESCAAIGGVITGAPPTGSPPGTIPTVTAGVGGNSTCNYGYVSYYNLVEEQDLYRLYGQFTAPINDWMEAHIDVNYGQLEVPKAFGSPAQPGVRGPAIATGLASQYYVPAVTNTINAANPFVAEFIARNGTGGVLPAGTQGFTINSFRAFAHGGNPVLGEGDGFGVPSKISNQAFRVSATLEGELPEAMGFLEGVGYNFGVTYNDGSVTSTAPDILGFRLQEALNGFGGPNCSAVDTNPNLLGTQNPAAAGKNGCQWFNPFASGRLGQPELGLQNPTSGTVRGLPAPAGTSSWENSSELIRWLFDERLVETKTNDLTIDLVFNSETPLALPGGNVGIAVGGQWRQVESRQTVPSDFYNGNTPCEWPQDSIIGRGPTGVQIPLPTSDPLFNGCTPDKPGPFVFFATNPPDYRDRQGYSLFAESSIPILDNLNFQAAVRRETFSGGFEATVYKVSGKWDVFGPLSIRGSYGTNYQAPPITTVPGEINNGVNSIAKAAGAWLGVQTITRSDIEPETAKSGNIGLIWQSQGLSADHDFRFIVDYFNIETEGEIRSLATAANIADLVFPGTANDGSALANCSSPLIGRIFFNNTATAPNGQCTQGQTRASDINVIQTEIGNGPSQTTSGYDITIDYSLPIGNGDLSFGMTATKLTELITSAQVLDGVTVVGAIDRLGNLNFGNVVGAVAVAGPEWRGNLFVNWSQGPHNVRVVGNYVSGVTDQRGPITLFPYSGTGTAVSPFVSWYGVNGQDWRTMDVFYTFDVTDTLRLTASMVNAFDSDPPDAREELGYDPLMGSPLGRTFEIGVKKTF